MPATNGHGSASHRTRLVGFHDLQGREALQVILQGDWCYVGHLPGEAVNPLTGKSESNGTSILDVSNPAQPKLVAHIASEPGANCRAVQVVKNPGDGKTYIARNHEAASGCSFQVFDMTDRTHPVHVSSVAETSAGRISFAHKGSWDEASGLYFGSVCQPGFRPGGHLGIWDLSKPAKPKYVSSYWIRGQKLDEPAPPGAGYSLHHPVLDMARKRVFLSYARGGNVIVLDERRHETGQSDVSIEPPFRPAHLDADLRHEVPNFTPGHGDAHDFIVHERGERRRIQGPGSAQSSLHARRDRVGPPDQCRHLQGA
jgi:hypothetical protein